MDWENTPKKMVPASYSIHRGPSYNQLMNKNIYYYEFRKIEKKRTNRKYIEETKNL